ncbi:hypothetical protein H5410_035981 [Solanum commersonii]|uniref:Uncharacterized protein n=1 Tax=Solanum commersonii TaxID=4109 RepID=A0A9J5Y3F0_SOLCO|nr:hypothetical protein H5410_035981 [Solanum commersonii]
MDKILGDFEPVFDQTPKVVLHPSTDSSDIDEDNVALRWAIQKRMVTITMNGKEKVIEETTKKRPFTRAISQKLMGDTMNSSETTTTENRRRRRSGDVVIELSADDVVDVSNKLSKKEGKGKQLKKSGKVKSRTPTTKKGDTTKGKEKESQKKRESSKRKKETSPVHKQNPEQGLGTKQRKDDKEVRKQMIVDNLRL